MCELMTEEKIEKIKASSVDIIVEKIDGKPYYNIKYFDLKENQGYIGFGSFNLDYVFGWKDKYFDIVDEDQRLDEKMSDDLISRKALLEEIQSFKCYITGLRAGKGNLARAADEYRKSILQIIEDQPTAFDKGRVIEELRRKHEKSMDIYNVDKKFNPECASKCIADAYKTTLDIVEKGGI